MAQRVVLAGGGTAGHIEPALAVAEALLLKDPRISCEFIGVLRGLESLLVPKRGHRIHYIPKASFPRRFSPKIILFPILIIAATLKARVIIKRADLVIGFGGYVSTPTYLAAWSLKVPILIHEANAKPGLANRLGRRFAKVTAVNFEKVAKDWPGSVLVGMPIRQSLNNLAEQSNRSSFRELNCQSWGFDPKLQIVAVFGGSLGSTHINSVIAEFLEKYCDRYTKVQIIHALGINNELPGASNNYLPLPYFHDMAAIYGSADLLITRSGAVTCSELVSLGKYSILIPLPHGNGEQIDNATALVAQGSALMVANDDFSAEWLNQNLSIALDCAARYQPKSIGSNSKAAMRIAELAQDLLSKAGAK
ncbi:MAG: UDP-N-acetylglucosamine--N-acetylmuramyl-(pentapeptide) pyrophosphoryl-undecaprenol N-acetylglucosamine transferase [Actinobacteria bacterium]|nr:UDP-N-acetylglucosamine--N-acetylmuramyl-(pentapeptide) pyrophosphoryl-undecaprenol N-acetylglucosamine transferase [Actinomycetota bacterium]